MGDFQGHPFRGNQWTSSGGVTVSRGDWRAREEAPPYGVPKTAREAARAIAQSLETHGEFEGQYGMSREQAEKNWYKSLRGRVRDVNPERRAIVEQAHRENLDNPRFREIVDTYQGGHGPVIVARPEKGAREKAGERLGDSTLIYDIPSKLADTDFTLHSEVPTPGAATAASHGGTAGVLRHEFGHHVFDVLEYNATHRQARDEISRAHARMADVGKELSYYAGTSHVEAFAEALAIGTHPKYDPSRYSEAARDYIATVLKHARAGRGKTVRRG